MEYESNILKRLVEKYGVIGNPSYISEIIKQFITRGQKDFPQLFTYQSDWLAHIDEFGLTPEYTVSYTGQHIYAPNTKERPVKRAILKGKTILWDNIENKETSNISLWVEGNYSINESTGEINTSTSDVITYFVEIPSNLAYINGTATWKKIFYYDEGLNFISSQRTNSTSVKLVTDIPVNAIYMRLQYYKTSDNLTLYPTDSYDNEIVLTRNISINTVKMPVLYTIGSNIFDSSKVKDLDSNWKEPFEPTTQLIRCNPNTKYYYNGKSFDYIVLYDENKNNISSITVWHTEGIKSFTTTSNCFFLGFKARKNAFDSINEHFISTNNYYEPYKTNILTVNEDVTLRSNGSECDELDLLTGKLTQRIDEDGEVLTQEDVKTVDLTIKDQNDVEVSQLSSFNGGTHFTTSSQDGTLLPTLTVDVVTDLEETLMVCSLEGNTM